MTRNDANNNIIKLRRADSVKTFCIISLFTVVIVCVLLYLTEDHVVVNDNHPESQKNVSLRCSANNLDYPFFRYDESISKTTDIDVIFHDSIVGSISIKHTLYYDSIEESIGSEAQNHASMGIHFAEDGLGTDPFSAHYSKQENGMSMTLYAKGIELNSVSIKYFLADSLEAKSSPEDFLNKYKLQGFACSISR